MGFLELPSSLAAPLFAPAAPAEQQLLGHVLMSEISL